MLGWGLEKPEESFRKAIWNYSPSLKSINFWKFRLKYYLQFSVFKSYAYSELEWFGSSKETWKQTEELMTNSKAYLVQNVKI